MFLPFLKLNNTEINVIFATHHSIQSIFVQKGYAWLFANGAPLFLAATAQHSISQILMNKYHLYPLFLSILSPLGNR